MFKVIESISDIGGLLKDLEVATEVAIDTETSGLDPLTCKLYSVQLFLNEHSYILNCLKFKNLEYVIELIAPKIVIGHNLKYDVSVLKVNTGILLLNCFCTQLAEVEINLGIGNPYPSLADVVLKYTGVVLDKTVRESFYKQGILTELSQQQLIYGVEDVMHLFTIKDAQLEQIKKAKMLRVWDMEMKVLPIMVEMELQGISMDKESWLRLTELARTESIEQKSKTIDMLLDRIYTQNFNNLLELAESLRIPVKTKRDRLALEQISDKKFYSDYIKKSINLGSTYQLGSALRMTGINVKSTGEDALLGLNIKDPIIDSILSYRGLDKLVSTYGQNFINAISPVDDKLHLQFNQLGTSTGRLSSGGNGINGQNIPRDEVGEDGCIKKSYRNCFIAPDGYKFINYDFNQQEFRLAGAITDDPIIIQSYMDGYDMHRMTASILYNVPLKEVTSAQRQQAKSVNFAILYGSSAGGLAWNFKITQKEGQDILDKFYGTYKVFGKAKEMWEDAIVKYGFATTEIGRRRYFSKPEIFEDGKSYEKWVRKVKKEGFNMKIQGCLPSDTKILTRDGGWIDIINFKSESDLVWTGEKWATATLVDKGEDTRIRLYLNDGRTFDCDTRHKLLIYDDVWPRWADMDEIVGKRLVRDTQTQFGHADEFSVEDWYWAGRWIGDGFLSDKKWTMAFGHTEKEEESANGMLNWLSTKDFIVSTSSKIGYKRFIDRYGNVYIQGSSSNGINFWKSMGLSGKSNTKRIPNSLFTLDYARRLSFFQGYFDADGYIRPVKNSKKITSKSHILLEDVAQLSQTLGMTGEISELMSHKNNKATWYAFDFHKVPHNLYVESIEHLGQENMYTLSVDDEKHAFSTEGLISKNTGADITKMSMIGIFYNNPFGEKLKSVLQQHDELLYISTDDVAEDAAEFVKSEMLKAEQVFLKSIPAAVEGKVSQKWEH